VKFNLDLSSEALFAGTVISVVLTLIVCATVYNMKPASCYAELRPSCAVPSGVVMVHDKECLATVARACSGG